jgi:hypothetical protein
VGNLLSSILTSFPEKAAFDNEPQALQVQVTAVTDITTSLDVFTESFSIMLAVRCGCVILILLDANMAF